MSHINRVFSSLLILLIGAGHHGNYLAVVFIYHFGPCENKRAEGIPERM